MRNSDGSSRARIALLSLGCAKNLVDSEHVASLLEAAGAEVTQRLDGADVAVVNTCGFIEPAKEESIEAILDAAAHKQHGRLFGLVITGCLSQRYGRELRELVPEADAVTGIDPRAAAAAALRLVGLPLRPLPSEAALRSHRLTPAAWSYLRISTGCDNRCAYCTIPMIRGPLRSRRPEELLREARALAERGVRELNVIAQDTTAYGTDLTGRPRVHELLRQLARVDGSNRAAESEAGNNIRASGNRSEHKVFFYLAVNEIETLD